MQTVPRQCKAFEGECQCEASAMTDPSMRDLCDTHEEKFKYLKDLYHNKHESETIFHDIFFFSINRKSSSYKWEIYAGIEATLDFRI
jgi:hypothetical protein